VHVCERKIDIEGEMERKGEGEGDIGDKKERKKERKRVVILYFMIVSHFFHGRPSQLVRCLVGWM